MRTAVVRESEPDCLDPRTTLWGSPFKWEQIRLKGTVRTSFTIFSQIGCRHESMRLSNKKLEIQLPTLKVGDVMMVGKFKNRKAIIKGFDVDKHGQPIALTDKGEQQIFKGRIVKLMDQDS